MDKLQIHHYLGLAGLALVLVSAIVYALAKPKGMLATAGGTLGGVLIGAAVGAWTLSLIMGYGWSPPDPGAGITERWLTPETAPQTGSGQAQRLTEVLIPKLKDASMDERADVFRMKKPGGK